MNACVASLTAYASTRPATPDWVRREAVPRYGLTMLERAALLCLWDHAHYWRDEGGPRLVLSDWSQPQIAREVGCTDRAVRRALVVLVAADMIAVHGGGDGVPVVYRLTEAKPSRVRFA